MSGMGKPGDEQTWVYDADTDTWYAGAASGGSGGPVSIITGSGGRINYHDTTYNPVGLWQLSGSLIDAGSQVTNLTVGVGTERYSNMGPGLRGFMFDGSTLLVNTASVPSSMALTGACTVEMLAIVEPTTVSQVLFNLGGLLGDVNGSENYLLQFAVSANGALDYFAEFDNGTNVTFTAEQATVPFNQLCHVALTRSNTNVVRFYVNGSLMQSSSVLTQVNTGSTAPSSARVHIGSSNNGSFTSVSAPSIKTSIASVKLVDRQLTDAEIAAEYQRTIGNLYDNTTVVSQSITNNNFYISGAFAGGFQQANYFFVTQSAEWLIPQQSTFVGMPGLTGTLTTTGGPVLLSVNANYTAQSGTPPRHLQPSA